MAKHMALFLYMLLKKKKKVQDAVRLSYQDLDNENKLSIP